MHVYSRSQLLQLRQRQCDCVKRKVKRKLNFFHIYVQHISVLSSPNLRNRRSIDKTSATFGRVNRSGLRQIPLTRDYQLVPKPVPFRFPPNIVYCNARSLRYKTAELTAMAITNNADIIAVSESWFDSTIDDESVSISGYNIVRCDRPSRSSGGVCLYIRHCLHYKEVNGCPM